VIKPVVRVQKPDKANPVNEPLASRMYTMLVMAALSYRASGLVARAGQNPSGAAIPCLFFVQFQ
jgi:hypothetical protein